jgi:hypothetical protein
VLSVVGKSAVYIKHSEGPNTLPCGTPDLGINCCENVALRFIFALSACLLFSYLIFQA